MNQLGCWIAAYLYATYYNEDDKISATLIYSFLGFLLGLWLISVFLFFNAINRDFWSTFYSTETGCDNAKAYFLEGQDDATRSIIFGRNIALWKSIRSEVKVWTLNNWTKWEKEKPDWFTAAFKASVPDDMMPKDVLDELNRMSIGGKRQRNSIVQVRRNSLALVELATPTTASD